VKVEVGGLPDYIDLVHGEELAGRIERQEERRRHGKREDERGAFSVPGEREIEEQHDKQAGQAGEFRGIHSRNDAMAQGKINGIRNLIFNAGLTYQTVMV
jgi:hypothetical protein